MRRLIFVTGNAGKVAELEALLGPRFEVVADPRGYTEIQAGTLREVCEAGADELLRGGLSPPFLLEDSGLFVPALLDFPGVFSRHALDTIGIHGLLRLLQGMPVELRAARFEADLMLVAEGARHHFAGVCRGTVALRPAGSAGFGFDPIFVPDGHTATFAQMDAGQKSALSHRGQAVRGLLAHLAPPS